MDWLNLMMNFFYNHTSLCSYTAFTVNDETGLKQFPFQLKPVPRLHWEDPTADHLMTHEVCVCVCIVQCVHICKQEDNLSVVRSSNDSLSIAHALLQCIFTHTPVTHWNLLYSLSTDESLWLWRARGTVQFEQWYGLTTHLLHLWKVVVSQTATPVKMQLDSCMYIHRVCLGHVFLAVLHLSAILIWIMTAMQCFNTVLHV